MSAPGNIKRAETTKSDWRTPQYIFNYWDERYHFTLDAAASAENALCPVYRDLKWDSLTNGWGVKDESAWLNSPFGNLLGWVERCDQEATENSNTTLACLPNNTDTKWFEFSFETASRISFLGGRVSYIDPATGLPISGNPGGTVFIAWYPPQFKPARVEVEFIRIPKPKPC